MASRDVAAAKGSHERPADLDVLGIRTRVLQAGAGDTAVVFLHGSPGSADDWSGLLPRIAPLSRCVAFDLPGYGSADRPSDWDYSPGSYATFIAAALGELGVKRAHLVMHDLGGVGALWGAAHPDQLASAVIIDTGVFVGYKWHGVARLNRTPVIGELMAAATTHAGFRAAMRRYNPQPRKLPDEHVERWWRDYDRGTRRAGMRFYRAAPPSSIERIAPALSRLDRPALVLWGAHDRFLPVEQAHLQRRSFPSAEVVILEDSGHWPFLDDPDRAAEHVVPFLERQLAG
jgi:pimeloyl-ACP methyl ester carboxylesterase